MGMQRFLAAAKMRKSVAVIGASASGLRMAKELLQTKQFDVTIFEKNSRVGGLWAVDRDSKETLVDPFMPTNLGKYSVNFSDLSWDSVGYNTNQPRESPMFPRAWQVGRYLETYRERYIPKDCLRLGCCITTANLLNDTDTHQWQLTWSAPESQDPQSETYDYLVVASGFFSGPRPIASSILNGLPSGNCLPKIIHNTQLRSLEDILPKKPPSNGKILVVGGGISGADAAASLALMLSSAKHSHEDNISYQGLQVIHMFSRHFYALPPFVPITGKEGHYDAFVPWDFVSYELSRRTQDPIKAGTGKVPPERARITHDSIRSMIGTDQSDISPAIVSQSLDMPPYVATNSSYLEFVRSGDIQPVYGRLKRLYANESFGNGALNDSSMRDVEPIQAEVESENALTQIEDIVGIVHATGYSPLGALQYLSEEVRQLLEYDQNSFRLPIILQDFQTHHPSIKNLAFVGFYEGPYWGIMEMQARHITKRWMNDNTIRNNNELENMRSLREAIHQKEKFVPQFWMADYLGLMENMAEALDIRRNDSGFGTKSGPVVPARYVGDLQSQEESQKTLAALIEDLQAAKENGRYAAAAAFRALQGTWKLRRNLESALASFPSGILTGHANFYPRYPTDEKFDGEYLYVEEGLFKTRQGFEMTATRSYVYRYSESADTISVWFVKPDGKTVDYLFHDIGSSEAMSQSVECWQGEADHLCVKDMYRTSYKFDFKGVSLTAFNLRHKVDGPKKDYASDSYFTR